jgi:hypothetical protein
MVLFKIILQENKCATYILGEKCLFCPFLVKKAFFWLFSNNHPLHFLKFILEILTTALNFDLDFELSKIGR